MDWTELSHLSIEEKKARFRQATITHRLLEQTHRKIVRAVREPAGFTFVMTYGPTGVGKSKMIETVVRQLNEELRVPSTPAFLRPRPPVPTPVLVIEADQPDLHARGGRRLLSQPRMRLAPRPRRMAMHHRRCRSLKQ